MVGIPDPLSGEVPKAFIVKKAGHSLSANEVAEYVASESSFRVHKMLFLMIQLLPIFHNFYIPYPYL